MVKKISSYFSFESTIRIEVNCHKEGCDNEMELLQDNYHSTPSEYIFKCHECMNEIIIYIQKD